MEITWDGDPLNMIIAHAGAKKSSWRSPRLLLCATTLASFLLGALLTAYVGHAAERDRVYQLLIYHAVPGKVPALVSRFRDASKLQAKHHLDTLGYWVPGDDPKWADTFVYLMAHRSREEANKNWASFHADPEFQKYLKAEEAEELIKDVDEVYMHPTDFSRLH